MTKEQLIEAIQTAEEKSYKELEEIKKACGEENALVKRYRTKWSALYDLCKELEIPTR